MNSIIRILEFGLDGSYAKHKAISNNIANSSTPGYKKRDVNFIKILNDNIDQLKTNNNNNKSINKIKNTTLSHMSSKSNNGINFKETRNDNTSYRNDGNNVDMDTEMAKLSKNNLYYNTLSQQVSQRFSLLQDVIRKGSE